MDTYLNSQEISDRLHKSRRTILTWLRHGKIKGAKFDSARWSAPETSIDKLANENNQSSEWLNRLKLASSDKLPNGIINREFIYGKGLEIDEENTD